MTEVYDTGIRALPLDALRHVDEVCSHFESAWAAGQRPRIEDYVGGAPDAERALVLRELIALEVHYRRLGGEAPSTLEYQKRFPDMGERWLSHAVGETPAGEGHRPAAASPPGPDSRYRPVRFHARGGLGEVWLARDEELSRPVALKRMLAPCASNAEQRRRFLGEAEITGRLEHPGIVPVYGLVQGEDGQPCYAMRFIEGQTLQEAIERFHAVGSAEQVPGARRLELRQLLGRFVAVCNAIAYAHSQGVVHRDLKPANIMLGPFGETLVVDWGLAKALARLGTDSGDDQPLPSSSDDSEGSTKTGQTLGTPAYMSPEQAAGRWNLVGPASDIFSLGATLHTLLTGQKPLQDWPAAGQPTPGPLAEAPHARPRRNEVPRALAAICRKAMAAAPADRYPTASALAGDLERWLADEAVSAYAEPWGTRALRWARRHRTAVTSGSVALCLLVAGALGGLSLWTAAERRAQEYQRDLLRSAEANEELGLAELHAGRFASAERIFRQAAGRLGREPALADLQERLEARRERVYRLAEYYRLCHSAERLMTHDLDQEGSAAFEAALALLHVFEHEDWWARLPADDMTASQQDRLRRDSHLRLLLLGGMRARRATAALLNWKNLGNQQAVAAGYRSALEAVAAAQRFRRTHTGNLLESFCRAGLGQPWQDPALYQSEPSQVADYYFMGLLNYWMAHAPDDQITLNVLKLAPGLSALDFKTPLETAEQHLRTAASLDPEYYWTYYWLGETLMAAKKYEAAELAYGVCVGLRPDYGDGYGKRADAILQQIKSTDSLPRQEQLFARALVDMNSVLRIEPEDGYPYVRRGQAYVARGDDARALADFTAAIQFGPRSSYPSTLAGAYASRAQLHSKQGNHEKALADFTEAIRAFPLDVPRLRNWLASLHNERGQVHFARGAQEEAIADYGEALRVHARSATAYRLRGTAHAEMEHWEKADADLRKALDLNKNQPATWSLLAHLALRAGDQARYRQTCADALAQLADTSDPNTAAQLAWMCVLTPDAGVDPARLVKLAERAIARNPGAHTLRTLMAAHYRAGQFAGAVQCLSMMGPAPDRESATLTWLFAAMAYQRLDKLDEARQWLDKAIQSIDEARQGRSGNGRAARLSWSRRLEYELLTHEARALLMSTKSGKDD